LGGRLSRSAGIRWGYDDVGRSIESYRDSYTPHSGLKGRMWAKGYDTVRHACRANGGRLRGYVAVAGVVDTPRHTPGVLVEVTTRRRPTAYRRTRGYGVEMSAPDGRDIPYAPVAHTPADLGVFLQPCRTLSDLSDTGRNCPTLDPPCRVRAASSVGMPMSDLCRTPPNRPGTPCPTPLRS
jgi:hypothetical protein